MNVPGMTINDLMGTDCLDVDEIFLNKEPKEKQIISMEEFFKNQKGGN